MRSVPWGIWVGGAYALMQIGRTAFVVAALPVGPLRRNYERIQVWCIASGALAVVGGLAHGHARELLWLLAVGMDTSAAASGSRSRGLAGRARRTGRSRAVTSPSAARRSS